MASFPRDPLITRHPAPLTAAEARAEVRDARGLRRRVPVGHPYGLLPTWAPYALARLVSGFVERRVPTRRPAVSRLVPLPPEPAPKPARAARRRRAFEERWTEA